MKRTGFALALLVFAFSPCTSFAQSMYPNYSSYQTVTASGTTITVSVTVDGSTSGSLCGQYGCIPTPTHTPSVYNSLKNTATGAVTGGWQTGPGVTWNSYLSQTNNQSVPQSSNVIFDVTSVTQIVCSAVGSFYFFQFVTTQIEPVYVRSYGPIPGTGCVYYSSSGVTLCHYAVKSWCTAATSPPDFNVVDVVADKRTLLPFFEDSIGACARTVSPKGPWVCSKNGLGLMVSQGNFPFPLGNCTHNP